MSTFNRHIHLLCQSCGEDGVEHFLHTSYVLLSAMFETWMGVSIIIVTLRWVDLMTVLKPQKRIYWTELYHKV